MAASTEPSSQRLGLFVAAGDQGERIVSSNGKDWRDLQLGKEGEIYRSAAAGNGHVVIVGTFGGNSIFATTPDGTTWTAGSQDAQYSHYLRGISFGNGSFIAFGGDPGSVGDSKPFVVFSEDGQRWEKPSPIAGKNIIRRIAWGGGKFVGVGDRGRRAVSTDGRLWQDAPNVKAIDTLVDVAFGNGRFVGVGLNGLRMTTEDGLTWSNRQVGEEGEHCNNVLFTGKQFVAVGQGATYFSEDGISWKRVENHNFPLFSAYGAGIFVGSAWKGRLLYSTDAIEWKEVYKSEYHFEAVCFG